MLPRIAFSRLRFYHFVDIKDQEMGSLEDVIIDTETLKATHIILGGGFFEEYMESSGQIDDIDELAPLEIIDHIDNDYIVLSKQLEELETTDKEGNLPVSGFKYTEFIKLSLRDDKGRFSGEIFDFLFDYDDSFVLMTHQGVASLLMTDQYYQKIELQVHIKHLTVDKDSLYLKLNPDEIAKFVKDQTEPKSLGKSRVIVD